MIRKIKYNIENFYYEFRINENKFSGNKINILLLCYYEGTFGRNNTTLPLKEIGNVFVYEMTKTPHSKSWYNEDIKTLENNKMLQFIDHIVSNNSIDVIDCHLSGHSTTPEILEKIRKLKIPMINESLDDERKFRSKKGKDGFYRGMKDICKYFDISLTTSKSAIAKYLVEGGKPIYKDYAGNEKIYKPLNLKKEYDVGFVGASYGVRGEYIKYLENHGINVYAKGNGWENGFATDDEMIEIFNKSKIVLGFSTVGKNDNINILKGRDFEVPLTGSFYITGYHEELKEYFDLGKDIETYTSKEDLLKKVKYYLENEKEREFIAKTGYEKCINNYTAKESYEKVFGYLGL
jgi:hypothetical protein